MTRETLQNIFRNPYSLDVWQNLLINLFGASEIRKTPAEIESDKHDKVSGYLLGELNTSDHYRIGLFAFEVGANTHIEMNRVGLRSLVRSYTKYQYDAAISVYYNDKQWRLSFISDLKGENTAPKRFTYVFGNEVENYRTAAGQLIKLYDTKPTFESIKDAFSVEKLSKDFFAGYKKQYDKFVDSIGDNKSNRDYVKKMMGRLVFLQFLQKKGWMGVPAAQDGWFNGDLQYTQNLVKRYEGDDKLLTNVLEVLFFDTLNSKRTDDIADPKLGDNIRIPYLNGGLFDKDTLDKKDIDFPYSYFAELLEFFSHYNFTIDENDPYDAEVGIDPEMLGHIFENLLEDNKDKGAFYTPKEIVQYMCRQSLIEYLQSKLGKHSEIEAFVNRHDVSSKFIVGNAGEIENHLDKVKICDPAIGSGAFPMGILNEVFHCKMALDLTLDRAETKKAIIQNSIYGVDIEQGAVDIARLRFWLSLVVDEEVPQPLPNLDYKIMCGNSLIPTFDSEYIELNRTKGKNSNKIKDAKRRLTALQNEFYSMSGAKKIAKEAEIKRTILSIIELQLNYELESSNAKVDTQGNIFEEIKFEKRAELTAEYGKQRRALNLIKTQLTHSQTDAQISDIEIPFFDWEINFSDVFDGEDGGFDIIIGNPPYIQLQVNGGLLGDMYKDVGFETFARTGDIYSLFYEQGIRLLRVGGVETLITSNKWMRAGYGEKTRAFFAKNNPLKLIDLGAGVFDSATVDTNILVLQKGSNKAELQAITSNKAEFANIHFAPMKINGGDIWTILSLTEQSIKNKIESIGTPLKDWDVEINYGIKTGYNEAFIVSTEKRDEILTACIDEDERERTSQLIRPMLRGRDIKRYSAQWAELWLICTFPALKLNIDNYPTLRDYLLTFGRRLHQTGEKDLDGIKGNNARKKTGNKWFETQDQISYYKEFEKDKIVYNDITQKLSFGLVESDVYFNNTAYFISNSKYINIY